MHLVLYYKKSFTDVAPMKPWGQCQWCQKVCTHVTYIDVFAFQCIKLACIHSKVLGSPQFVKTVQNLYYHKRLHYRAAL